MERFNAGIKHNEESIRRLSKVQYDTYGMGKKLRIVLSGIIILCAGIFLDLYQGASILLTVLGCWLIVSFDMPQRRQADKLISLIACDYPVSEYSFLDDGLKVISGGQERSVPYGKIIGVYRDGAYFYIFISRMSAYMIPVYSLLPNNPNLFESFLGEKTGLKVLPVPSLARISLRSISERISNRRTIKERDRDSK